MAQSPVISKPHNRDDDHGGYARKRAVENRRPGSENRRCLTLKIIREESGQLMKGQVGTPVSLTVKRIGVEKPIKLEFKREKIKLHNVPYYGMVSNDIAYVQLTDFTPDAAKEVKNAITALKEQGAKGVILDLRGNWWLLLEAVNIQIYFFQGQLVVSTKARFRNNLTTRL